MRARCACLFQPDISVDCSKSVLKDSWLHIFPNVAKGMSVWKLCDGILHWNIAANYVHLKHTLLISIFIIDLAKRQSRLIGDILFFFFFFLWRKLTFYQCLLFCDKFWFLQRWWILFLFFCFNYINGLFFCCFYVFLYSVYFGWRLIINVCAI